MSTYKIPRDFENRLPPEEALSVMEVLKLRQAKLRALLVEVDAAVQALEKEPNAVLLIELVQKVL